MAGWVGPTVAISLLLIALCIVGLTIAAAKIFHEAQEASRSLSHELAELRHELAPMLNALNRFGDAGADVVESARAEVKELVNMSQELRADLRKGSRRAKRRLADFDALLEVMQEEVEETALDTAMALRTLRTSRGVIGQVRHFLVPRRRGHDE